MVDETIENRLLPDDSFNIWPHLACMHRGAERLPTGRCWRVSGYANFLEAIADPSHDELAAMWQWSGGPFDATGFDVNATNAALRRLR